MLDALGFILSLVKALPVVSHIYNWFQKLELTDVEGYHWIDKYSYTHFEVGLVLKNKGDRKTTVYTRELVIFHSQPEKSETIQAGYSPTTDLEMHSGDAKRLIFSFVLGRSIEDERVPVRLCLTHTYNKLTTDLESRFRPRT